MQKTITAKTLHLFSSPVLLHYTLPVLMLCLIIGTIAQKYIGLYEATRIFFASPFLWLGPVPLPGLPLILALIALNLTGKLLFKSPWTIRSSGIIITHIGALMLLVGGLLTAMFSTEGYVELVPQKKTTIVSDYHAREFVIENQNGESALTLDHNALMIGQTIPTPFSITIVDLCRHCKIEKRTDADETFHGMAQHMKLIPATLKTINEENMGGVTFRVDGVSADSNGTYVVLEDIPQNPEFKIGDQTYRVALRKSRRNLPFSIELLDFKREVYAGTDKPKSYESTVRIHDNGMEWQSVISMNAPLRYKGYTFFQSSFIATPDGDISVLAAVWNVGRTFPYISSLTMGFGILLHLILRSRRW